MAVRTIELRLDLLSILLRFLQLKTLAQALFTQFDEVLFCCRNND